MKPPYKILSAASIGKAHLEKMGIKRWNRQFPPWLIGAILETYYGGRTECRIRLTPVPGVYLDFKSQYPSVFVLQGLWRYVIAKRIRWLNVDPREIQAELGSVDLQAVLDPELWRELNVICLIEPDGDRLPTRARFSAGPRRNYNLAVSLRSGGSPVWMTKADCIASVLHTGKAPRVLRALRFEPIGVQEGLRPMDVGGDPRYRVDPSREDLIQRLVEMRTDAKAEQAAAKKRGDTEQEEYFKAIQLAMKTTANAIAYGAGIEMNVVEHRRPVNVSIHLSDQTSYGTRAERTEQPGSYFNPLLATLVTGGGRLLLAAAMSAVEDVGGAYAYSDTDSIFVVAKREGGLVPCEAGPHRMKDGREAIKARSWSQVNELAAAFESLNPYDRERIPGSILEIESENFDPKTGRQREIECFAIASKRAARFVRSRSGKPIILGDPGDLSRSEHGLGHLLSPLQPNPDIPDGVWMDRWWEHLLCRELGIEDPEPDWFSDPAVGRIAVTSPREEKSFRHYNEGRSYDEQVTPWCFMSIAHPIRTERARENGPRCLIAPFERDPKKRRELEWYDRGAPRGKTCGIRVDNSLRYLDGSVAVQSYGDYFAEYRRHPERKMLGPDGKSCRPWTRGRLQPRHVQLSDLHRIGKESNRLAETAMPLELDEHGVVEYGGPLVCHCCGKDLSGVQRKWCSDACRKRESKDRRANS
jgi:hypothetical protein